MGRGLSVLRRGAAFAAAGVPLLVLAGCGSSGAAAGGVSTPLATATTLTLPPAPAGPTPSASAQLICSGEVQKDLGYTLGVKPVAPVRPTWTVSSHVYACTYRYGSGAEIALSVKELSSPAETSSYYGSLRRRLGDVGSIPHLGQGAFSTRNGDTVVRKDWRVLLVDVSKLPARFGSPATSRADVAITVADVVIACWTGN